jgi:hypothetical protein
VFPKLAEVIFFGSIAIVNPRLPAFLLVRSAVVCSLSLALWGLASAVTAAQDASKSAVAAAQDANKEDTSKEEEYEEIPSDKEHAAFDFPPVLTRGKFQSKEEEEGFVAYCNLVLLPHWTQKKYYSRAKQELPDLRKKLRNGLVAATRHSETEVHDKLNEVVLAYMDALANDRHPTENRAADFRPEVRVNAALTISDLNAQEGPKPTPLPDALPVLLKCVDNPKQLEAVRVAAMVGILRQVAAEIDDPALQKHLVASMLNLLKMPVAEGQAEGRAWLLAQGAEVVGKLGSPADNGAFASGLSALAGDAGASFCVRRTAARGMKELNLGNAKNPGVWAAALGELALDAVKAENSPANPERLKARLSAVLAGLTHVTGATDEAHRPAADDLKKAVDKLAKENTDTLPDALKDGRDAIAAALQALRK